MIKTYYIVRDDDLAQYVTNSKDESTGIANEFSYDIDDAAEFTDLQSAAEVADNILAIMPNRTVSIIVYLKYEKR